MILGGFASKRSSMIELADGFLSTKVMSYLH